MDFNIDLSGVVLETARLRLRPWTYDDLEDFYAYSRVPGVGEMAGWKHHESTDESRKIIDEFIAGKNVLAVELRETGKAIGSVGLHTAPPEDTACFGDVRVKEVGYVISKDFWGRGLMPEALNAFLPFCFDMGLEAITVGHFTHNPQSRRVIEKCGFAPLKDDTYRAEALDKVFDEKKYVMFGGRGFNVTVVETSDAEGVLDYLRLIGSESDNLTFGAEGLPFTVEQEVEWIENIRKAEKDVMFVARSGRRIIGDLSLSTPSSGRLAHRSELGIAVVREFWHRGVGTALMRSALAFARSAGQECLWLDVRSDNDRAAALYRRFGFEYAGRFDRFFKMDGKFVPADRMILNL